MKKFLILAILLLTVNAHAADQWAKDEPAGNRSPSDIDFYIGINNEATDRLVANYRQGVKLKYNSAASITITTGSIVCSNSDGSVRKFRKNTSEINTTWAVGSNGLDTGAEAANTTYYVYAVCDADAETFTTLISTNSSAPSGATYYKRLGYFSNNASSDIESLTNDDANSISSTGTASNGSTISLPSGFSNDECDVIVSANSQDCFTNGGGIISDVEATYSVNSSRVVTATCAVRNNSGTLQTSVANTVNYLINCNR